jgi:hypothetical protein
LGTTVRVAVPAGAKSPGLVGEAVDEEGDDEEHAETVKITAAKTARTGHADRPLRRTTPLFRANATP